MQFYVHIHKKKNCVYAHIKPRKYVKILLKIALGGMITSFYFPL